MKKHFEAILEALQDGVELLSGIDPEVTMERPVLPMGDLPPTKVRAIIHIEGHYYSVDIECLAVVGELGKD